ncbi:unnamed protein product [Lactuca saligna]|uniref:LOB domain-containing protein n=1 Tax=Lactuca saligna TaxID=75948 RepID=A0AA35ZGP8_LACSI|nr:unnamed protein product [Lactuca saligna]
MSNNGGGGPCGACKFLRRKCVKSCVFAPYFDSDQGTTHFAAVHRVFGASNTSKLLFRVPPHRRLDAVVSLCYEALSRVRDPVYGCVANIFSLQQQVINLQEELTYIRARISMLQQSPLFLSTISIVPFEHAKSEQTSLVLPECSNNDDTLIRPEPEENDLEMLARDFLTKYVSTN